MATNKNTSVEGKPKRKRIITFDIMRGIFMLVIIIDHMIGAYGESIFVLFTGGGGLPASAAEGFFILSGLMVGYIYGPKMLTHTNQVVKRFLNALVICIYSLFSLHFSILFGRCYHLLITRG